MHLFQRLILILALPAALLAEAPPPPSFSFESTTETSGVIAEIQATPTQVAQVQSSAADAKLFNNDENLPAAPVISDEALVSNAMEVAYQLYHAEDFLGSAQACQGVIDRYPKKDLLAVRYLLGLSLEHTRTYVQALDVYKNIIKRAPKSTYSYAASFRIGLSQLEMGRRDEAIRTLRDIIDFHPQSQYRLQAFVHLGNLYRRLGEWKQAEVIYKDLVRLFPCTNWAHTGAMYLAECYTYQGEEKGAMRIYRAMQQQSCMPRIFAAQAQLKIADMHMNKGRFQEAIQCYYTAIREYADVAGIVNYSEEKLALAREGRTNTNALEKRSRNITLREAGDQ
jgi:TolA-binding protein